MTCRVADSNEDYTGSATYAFTIGRRAAAVKPKNAYYAPAVKWAADNGVTEGIGGLFGPNNDCTRADRHVPLPALREGVGAHEDTYIIERGKYGAVTAPDFLMVRNDTNAYAIEMEGTQRSKSARREGEALRAPLPRKRSWYGMK